MSTLPRFAKKEIRDFAFYLTDHGWVYTGDDAKGHARFSYPSTGATYSLPETPKYFPIQKNRALVLKLMGKEPGKKRSAKPYQPPKAAPREALTGPQLNRLTGVIEKTFDQLALLAKANGQPDLVARVLSQARKHVVDQVRKCA